MQCFKLTLDKTRRCSTPSVHQRELYHQRWEPQTSVSLRCVDSPSRKKKKTGHCWRVETERFTLRHCSRCSDRLSSTAIKTVRWRWIWWRPVCSDSQRWLLEAVKDCTWRFPSQVSLLFQLWNQCFRCSAVCFHHASVWTSYSAEFPGPPSNCFLSFTVEYQ